MATDTILWTGTHLNLVKRSGFKYKNNWFRGCVAVCPAGDRYRTVSTLLVTSGEAPAGCEVGRLTKDRLARYIAQAEELDAEWPARQAAKRQRQQQQQELQHRREAIRQAERMAAKALLNAALGDSLDELIAARAAYRAAAEQLNG